MEELRAHWKCGVAGAVAGLVVALLALGIRKELWDPTAAAWAQAIGIIATIMAAIVIGVGQNRAAVRRDQRHRNSVRQAGLALAEGAIDQIDQMIKSLNTDGTRMLTLGPYVTLTFQSLLKALASFPPAELAEAKAINAYVDVVALVSTVDMNYAIAVEQAKADPQPKIVKLVVDQLLSVLGEIRPIMTNRADLIRQCVRPDLSAE